MNLLEFHRTSSFRRCFPIPLLLLLGSVGLISAFRDVTETGNCLGSFAATLKATSALLITKPQVLACYKYQDTAAQGPHSLHPLSLKD